MLSAKSKVDNFLLLYVQKTKYMFLGLVIQSCPILCDPMNCSPLGSSVHGLLQARMLEWEAIPFSRSLLDPGNSSPSEFFLDSSPSEPPGKPTAAAAAKSLQSCPTLCSPMNCSPLGSSVHGILQARILEWVAIPFSRTSS